MDLSAALDRAIELARTLFRPDEVIASLPDGRQCQPLDPRAAALSYLALMQRAAHEAGDPALCAEMWRRMDWLCDGVSMQWAERPGRTRADLQRMLSRASKVPEKEPGEDG